METVEDIIKEIRQIAHNISVADEKTLSMFRPVAAFARIADRLDAAYRREMNALADANNIAMKTVAKECDMLRDAVSVACDMCVSNVDGMDILNCNGDCVNCPLRPGRKEVE